MNGYYGLLASEGVMAGLYWSAPEVAELLGYSRQAIYKMAERGDLPGSERLGVTKRKSLVIPRSIVAALARERANEIREEIRELSETLARLEASEIIGSAN